MCIEGTLPRTFGALGANAGTSDVVDAVRSHAPGLSSRRPCPAVAAACAASIAISRQSGAERAGQRAAWQQPRRRYGKPALPVLATETHIVPVYGRGSRPVQAGGATSTLTGTASTIQRDQSIPHRILLWCRVPERSRAWYRDRRPRHTRGD